MSGDVAFLIALIGGSAVFWGFWAWVGVFKKDENNTVENIIYRVEHGRENPLDTYEFERAFYGMDDRFADFDEPKKEESSDWEDWYERREKDK